MRLNYSNTANITDMWECIGNIPVMSVKGMCWQCYCDEWQWESIGNVIVMSVNVLVILFRWLGKYWYVILMSVKVCVMLFWWVWKYWLPGMLFWWMWKYWYVILMSVKVLVCYADECESSNYSMLLWCVKVLVTLPVLWWVYKESACYSDECESTVLIMSLWRLWMY